MASNTTRSLLQGLKGTAAGPEGHCSYVLKSVGRSWFELFALRGAKILQTLAQYFQKSCNTESKAILSIYFIFGLSIPGHNEALVKIG